MRETARAVVLTDFGEPVQLQELPLVDPEPGGLVARVTYGGICGTDLHLREGRLPIPRPVVLGHEAVGRVEQLGDEVTADVLGAPLAEGDAIAWASNVPCGRCEHCLVHQERTLCRDRRVYGINQRSDEWPYLSGGWAEQIVLRPGSTVVRLPDGVEPVDAISLGCAGPTVVHGLERLGAHTLGTVVVQGAGPVGLAACLYARLRGADRIVLVGAPRERLDLARRHGLAEAYLDIEELADRADRVEAALEAVGSSDGADVVVEATGVPAAVGESLDMARPGGAVLVLGQYTDRGETPLNPHLITRKQLRVLGSWAFAERHYIRYVQSLRRLVSQVDLRELVTPYPLAQANEAMAAVAAGRIAKAVLDPSER